MKKSTKIENKKMEAVLNARTLWYFNPVERIKQSKKVYSRKGYKVRNDMD